MSRNVQRRPARVVKLRSDERSWWPLNGFPPTIPQNVTPRSYNYFVWKSFPVRSNFRQSTEHASVYMRLKPCYVETSWVVGGYKYHQKGTYLPLTVDNTCLSSVYYNTYGWVTPPAYVLERCATEFAGEASKAYASLLTTMGESLQLATYISDKSRFLAKATSRALRADWVGLRRLVRREFGAAKWDRIEKRESVRPSHAQANGWMEMNYAILPTVGDIMTVTDIYNGILSRKASRFLVLKTQGDYERTHAPTSSLVTGATEKHSFRAKAVYSIDDAVLAGLSLIGLTDVPGTAVELMRWSWLADWLVPVSSWASSMTPTIGMNLVDAFVGARVVEDHYQAKRSFRPSGCPAANAKPYSIDPLRLEGSWRKKIDVRAHLVAKNPFSMSHLATTAAVIRQLS